MESLNSPTPPFPVENSCQAVRPGRHTSLTALAPCLRGPLNIRAVLRALPARPADIRQKKRFGRGQTSGKHLAFHESSRL